MALFWCRMECFRISFTMSYEVLHMTSFRGQMEYFMWLIFDAIWSVSYFCHAAGISNFQQRLSITLACFQMFCLPVILNKKGRGACISDFTIFFTVNSKCRYRFIEPNLTFRSYRSIQCWVVDLFLVHVKSKFRLLLFFECFLLSSVL